MDRGLNPMKCRVSIGLPVYNGENYLPENLESLLAQTFTDFEVIISDNASTDSTREICRTYVARDRRVRYFRNEENRGIAWNHNNVFTLARGEYFLWIGHDDVLAPQYLERCVAILDKDLSLVLCYSQSKDLDERGQFFDDPLHCSLATDSLKPHVRFHDLVCIEHSCLAIFGVMRAEVLKKTVLHGYYPSGDRVLLAQLGLFGCFHQIPEPLIFRRIHLLQSSNGLPHLRMVHFDPKRAGRIVFPRWEMIGGFLSCISNTPISRYEQILCYVQVIKALKSWSRELIRDVVIAFNLQQALSGLRSLVGNH